MKPTIKIPYKDFLEAGLLKIHQDSKIEFLPSTALLMRHSSDGDIECCEYPEYIEVEIDISAIESGKGINQKIDTCSICGCFVGDGSGFIVRDLLLCAACYSKTK